MDYALFSLFLSSRFSFCHTSQPSQTMKSLSWKLSEPTSLLMLLVLVFLFSPTSSFVSPSFPLASVHRRQRTLFDASSAMSNQPLVNEIIEEIDVINAQKDDDENNNEATERANNLLDQLIEASTNASDVEAIENPDFDALIGYYNVSYTRTARVNDNPVGGKWTRSPKFWNVRRTLQHILPPVKESSIGQAINVIRLDLLGGLIPIWIMLRGDAVPLTKDLNETLSKTPLLPNLTNRSVRAYFDRPRIAVGKFAFSLGPTSSVVIDTPYVDDRLRVGIGGTSGTKFVFKRVPDSDKEAIEEWKWLLNRKSMITKRKLGVGLAIWGGLSSWVLWKSIVGTYKPIAWKLVSGLSTFASAVGLAFVLSSTGGIETDSDTYAKGK